MSAHRFGNDYARALALKEVVISDPGAGGTFDLLGNGISHVTVSATGTYILPNADPGTILFVHCDDTSVVTLQDAGGTFGKFTGTSGTTSYMCQATDSNSWAGTRLGRTQSEALPLSNVGTITVGLMSITQEDGTVLAKQSSTTSGWSQLSNKNVVLNIPVNATNEAFAFSVSSPVDMDSSQPIYVELLASKSADNDALTLDCELYATQQGGGGVSADLVTTTAQTVSDDASDWLTFTCTAPSASDGFGGVITVGGTNDGDAIYLHAVRIRYTRA